jgi:exonuclease III
MTTLNEYVHIISINVQGLRDKLKRARVKQYILLQRAHIAFLQETHFTEDLKVLSVDEFSEWDLYHSHGDSKSKGVSIIIKKSLQYVVIDTYIDTNGRYILINIETQNNNISLLNIYAPNDKKQRNVFFDLISKILNEHSQGIKLIGGDFNEINDIRDIIIKK